MNKSHSEGIDTTLMQVSEGMTTDLPEIEETNEDESFDSEGDNVEEEAIEEEEEEAVEEEEEDAFGYECYANWEETAIDGMMDLSKINLKNLNESDVRSLHFLDRDVAFLFYNWYAKLNGFAARRSKLRKNNKHEIVQQAFVCSREGFREPRPSKLGKRKRGPKPETRCGCLASIRVHVDFQTGRWIVTFFSNDHNHELLPDLYIGMLPAHRRMNEADIDQMNNMRKVGISTPHIYSSFAHMSGGFHNVGFGKRDMYNQIDKQKRMVGGDARAAIAYLREMGSKDPALFWRHKVDEHGMLLHLFWCDAISQIDYEIFGDVVAFDATYRKNKYMCPLVVFSGVNHHNQTIVFGSAVVANETEDTYVWLLEQFVAAMKGKTPKCVITDGDLAMKNAIERVFPKAHHRLCAWHLIRNATSNIGNPKFTSQFKKCMLGDHEIVEFRRRWDAMVSEFGLQDNNWVLDMYEKRKMWATAHIRGNFFAGFRTTSRCEGLHSQLGKFVHSRNNLVEFIEQFVRCLNSMRYKEVEADFASLYGFPVMQTHYKHLERHDASVFTREIFFLFRSILARACTMKLVRWKETAMCVIFTVGKYCNASKEWQVSFCQPSMEFKCSCLRMESIGIPCDHIVFVLVHLDISELPECLIMDRWTKSAKSKVGGMIEKAPFYSDSLVICRYGFLIDICRQLCNLTSKNPEEFNDVREKVRNEISLLMAKNGAVGENSNDDLRSNLDTDLRDPVRVRSKGCGGSSSGNGRRGKRTTRCGVCRGEGHNRVSCPVRAQFEKLSNAVLNGYESTDEEDGFSFYNEYSNSYRATDDINEPGNADIQSEAGYDDDNEYSGGISYPYYSLHED